MHGDAWPPAHQRPERPTRPVSAAAGSSSGPEPATKIRLPGRQAVTLRQQLRRAHRHHPRQGPPGKGTTCSCALVARITALARRDEVTSPLRYSDSVRSLPRCQTRVSGHHLMGASATQRSSSSPWRSVTENARCGFLPGWPTIYWPPATGDSSSSVTFSPKSDATKAAANPAGPAPITARSVTPELRDRQHRRGAAAYPSITLGGPGLHPHSSPNWRDARALIASHPPSPNNRSKHPSRRRSRAARRSACDGTRSPAAINAAATVCPLRTEMVSPFTWMVNDSCSVICLDIQREAFLQYAGKATG